MNDIEFEKAWKEIEAIKDKVRKKLNWHAAQVSVDALLIWLMTKEK